MSDPDFYLKQHDTAPSLIVSCSDLAGNLPIGDLTGATVKFTMKAIGGGSPKVNAATGSVIDILTWQLGYSWVTGDTDTVGTFQGEFEVTYASGKKQTFPDPAYLTILITADLDGV